MPEYVLCDERDIAEQECDPDHIMLAFDARNDRDAFYECLREYPGESWALSCTDTHVPSASVNRNCCATWVRCEAGVGMPIAISGAGYQQTRNGCPRPLRTVQMSHTASRLNSEPLAPGSTTPSKSDTVQTVLPWYCRWNPGISRDYGSTSHSCGTLR